MSSWVPSIFFAFLHMDEWNSQKVTYSCGVHPTYLAINFHEFEIHSFTSVCLSFMHYRSVWRCSIVFLECICTNDEELWSFWNANLWNFFRWKNCSEEAGDEGSCTLDFTPKEDAWHYLSISAYGNTVSFALSVGYHCESLNLKLGK